MDLGCREREYMTHIHELAIYLGWRERERVHIEFVDVESIDIL